MGRWDVCSGRSQNREAEPSIVAPPLLGRPVILGRPASAAVMRGMSAAGCIGSKPRWPVVKDGANRYYA